MAQQLTVTWSSPGHAQFPLGSVDAPTFKALTVRGAPNPASGETTLRMTITLVDVAGCRATVAAHGYGSALRWHEQRTEPYLVLHGSRIPLDAFAGIDRSRLAALELGFADNDGSLQLADFVLQRRNAK